MKKILLPLLILLIASNLAMSQKVALVLSGGGAKGLAHVGLIRALEENDIPIDYIAGTSMGAIVGSLYAIGYSPDEMEAMFKSPDYMDWAKGIISDDLKFYYKNPSDKPDWGSMQFKLHGNKVDAILPTNLISPEQMDLRFLQIFAQASAAAGYDYDSLMVPFFCVASDIHNAKPVIFDGGDLAQAVRASMTFPGYFRPITVDSALLFDGGMQNNFPTDIMQERYAPDVIIGCKVSENPKMPDENDFYEQLTNIFMKPADYNMPENGILVSPDVLSFSLMDFDKYDTIAHRGYVEAMNLMDSIKLLIDRRVSVRELASRRTLFRQKFKPLTFTNVNINGLKEKETKHVMSTIRRGHNSITFNQFEDRYFKLASDRLVQKIYPRAHYNDSTKSFDLNLDMEAKNSVTLKVGGNITTGYHSFIYLGADYIHLTQYIHEFSANLYMGQYYQSMQGKVRTEFMSYPFLGTNLPPFFLDVAMTYNHWNYFNMSNMMFMDSDELSRVENTDRVLRFTIGTPVDNRGLLYSDMVFGRDGYDYYRSSTIARTDESDYTSFTYSQINVGYEYKLLNYRQYATKGRHYRIQMSGTFGREHYTPGITAADTLTNLSEVKKYHSWASITGTANQYVNINKYFTLGYMAQFNYSGQGAFSNSISTRLFAKQYSPTPHSKELVLEQFRANAWFAAGVIPIYTITNSLQLRGELHAISTYRDINPTSFKTTYSDVLPVPRIMASASLVYQTLLGPFCVSANYYQKESDPFYFNIHFGLVMFNRKGMD